MMALALPRIAPGVPHTITPGSLQAINAGVSRFLIEAEAFDEVDLPPTWLDSLSACEHGLDQWLKRQIGPLHCLKPRFCLHMMGREGYCLGTYGSMPHCGDLDAVAATWAEEQETEWPVGERLGRLNKCVRGLGAVVLHVLRCQSRGVYPLFTPELACDVASYLYWQGESDEETALDMNCGDDEAEREAMRAEMVTKAKLEAAYPAWAREWPRGLEMPQCARFLRRALKRGADPTAKAVAADALALCELTLEDRFRPEVDGEYIGFGAVLSWIEGDVTVRIYDDLLDMAHQAENCSYMGEIDVALDDSGKFYAWQRAMGNHFEAIRLIDRLIHRLSAGD